MSSKKPSKCMYSIPGTIHSIFPQCSMSMDIDQPWNDPLTSCINDFIIIARCIAIRDNITNNLIFND